MDCGVGVAELRDAVLEVPDGLILQRSIRGRKKLRTNSKKKKPADPPLAGRVLLGVVAHEGRDELARLQEVLRFDPRVHRVERRVVHQYRDWSAQLETAEGEGTA